MIKIHRYIEIAYLIAAIFFIVNAVVYYSSDTKKAGICLILGVLATFMFFFKRWFRKNRFEKKD